MSDRSPKDRVGPWLLLDRLGEGGMGEVWEASHAGGGSLAAVKLLHARSTATSAEALEREVRAAAGLSHGAVVAILDADLRSARPWVAMELVGGGTLLDLCGRTSWSEALEVLERLLEALAHAHSREVLHLDVKPQNVLVQRIHGGLHAKLGDFGLALLGRESLERARVSGSPAYMAPEQYRAQWRRFGPQTDLYAVGCLATHLVQGAPPFLAESFAELRSLHLGREPRALRPAFPVPQELEEWVLRLLEKRPADRFPTAAHALSALRELADPVDADATVEEPTFGALSTDTFVVDDSVQDVATWEVDLALLDRRRPRFGEPVLPASGRQAEALAPVPPPGTALWGLQRIPLVGREAEQDALWSGLVGTAREKRAHVRVLRGEAGVGRTALGRWLVERAAELGVARVLAIPAVASGESALAKALARWARATGLDGDLLRERVAEAMDLPRDRPAVELVAAAVEGAGDAVPAWIRLVEELGARGPVVVWADDGHLDAQVVALVEQLAGLELGLLVVVGARTSDPAELLAAFDRTAAAWPSVELAALGPAETLAVVERSLGLDPVLAARVAERASGNPALAESIVATWVRDGALVPSSSGLRVRAEAEVSLPDEAHDWWKSRLERVVHPGDGGWEAAEVGAVLGYVVRQDELVAACRAAGVFAPADLGQRMVEDRLAAQVGPGLWRFGGVGVRECLLRTAAESGRLERAHRAVASSLGDGDPTRVAAHRIGAGELDTALPLLLAATREALDRGDLRGATRSLTDWESTIQALGIGAEDARWAPGWSLASEVWALRGDFERSLDRANRALAVCAPGERASNRILRARAYGMLDEYERSEEDNREALALAREAGDAEVHARALWNLSFAVRFQGRVDEAEALLTESVQRHRELGTAEGDAVGARGEASIALMRREAPIGARRYARAAERFRAAGLPIQARTCHFLASIGHRWAMELEPAWEQAMASSQVADGDRRPVHGLNTALIAWALGRHELARRELRRAVNRGLDPEMRLLAEVILGAGAMGIDYRLVLEGALDSAGHGGHHIADLAWAFELGAREAGAAGRAERRQRLEELAVAFWERWGSPAYAARVRG